MPTLGEFIAHARAYGFRRHIISLERGASTHGTIAYLWRDPEHFVELPSVPESKRLPRDVVDLLCRRLGIPGEDFGLTGKTWREPVSEFVVTKETR